MERYLDGLASADDVTVARHATAGAGGHTASDFASTSAAYLVTGTAHYSARKCAGAAARAFGLANSDNDAVVWDADAGVDVAERAHEVWQASLLRHVFGTPEAPTQHRLLGPPLSSPWHRPSTTAPMPSSPCTTPFLKPATRTWQHTSRQSSGTRKAAGRWT
jgi:hypothetical protein